MGLTKKKLQALVDTFDHNLDVTATSKDTLSVKIGDKNVTRKIEDDAGVSQALIELTAERDTHSFLNSFKPSDKASNKTDGKDGVKADKKAKEKE